jgi:hypothetical protein
VGKGAGHNADLNKCSSAARAHESAEKASRVGNEQPLARDIAAFAAARYKIPCPADNLIVKGSVQSEMGGS